MWVKIFSRPTNVAHVLNHQATSVGDATSAGGATSVGGATSASAGGATSAV